MENEKNEKKRKSTATVRKASTHGVTTQKMVTFKCDLENVERLKQVVNKGRLINELLDEHFKKASQND